MTDAQRFTAIYGIISSNLYLAGVFVAGLVTAHPFAWKTSLATTGIVYLSAFIPLGWAGRPQQEFADSVGALFVIVSILLGAAAGIGLLF